MLCKHWIELEKPFASNSYDGNRGGVFFEHHHGSQILLLTRHSVNHQDKRGEDKWAELYTGGLVKLLSEKTNVSHICRVRRGRLAPQITAWEHIKPLLIGMNPSIILDIHGALYGVPFDIGISTGIGDISPEQQLLINTIKQESKKLEMITAINPEGYNPTWIRNPFNLLAIDFPASVSLSINCDYRNPTYKAENAEKTILMMENIIRSLSN